MIVQVCNDLLSVPLVSTATTATATTHSVYTVQLTYATIITIVAAAVHCCVFAVYCTVYAWLTYEALQNPVALQGFSGGAFNLEVLTSGFSQVVLLLYSYKSIHI
jgi:hypothetical protein